MNGAAGGLGTFAVQIARSIGADVTGVCATRNLEMVRSIGADRAIDYTRGVIRLCPSGSAAPVDNPVWSPGRVGLSLTPIFADTAQAAWAGEAL